jgi:hypothetical protein
LAGPRGERRCHGHGVVLQWLGQPLPPWRCRERADLCSVVGVAAVTGAAGHDSWWCGPYAGRLFVVSRCSNCPKLSWIDLLVVAMVACC